jgi:hypothetical protein
MHEETGFVYIYSNGLVARRPDATAPGLGRVPAGGEGGIRTPLKGFSFSFAKWLAYRFTYVGREAG